MKNGSRHASNTKLILFSILSGAIVLRLWGIDFGLPDKFRPDEEYFVSRALSFRWREFKIDPELSLYPACFMYIASLFIFSFEAFASLFGWFGNGDLFDFLGPRQFAPAHLLARVASALMGTCTVYFAYLLGKTAYSKRAGIFGAAFLAVNFVHVRDSHYAVSDVPMTFFITLSLLYCIKLYQDPLPKNYILAGIFSGLAIAAKYTAFTLAAPVGVAHIAAMLSNKYRLWSVKSLSLSLLVFVVTALFFFFGSPYVFLRWGDFVNFWQGHAKAVNEGLIGVTMPFGWEWLFKFALRYSAGVIGATVFVLALLASFKELFAKCKKVESLILASFVIALIAAILPNRWIFLRYIIPAMAPLALLCAYYSFKFFRIFLEHRPATLIWIVLLLAISADPLIRAVQVNQLFSKIDTRIMVLAWIENNIPAGSEILVHSDFFYGKPAAPPGYKYVRLQDLNNRVRKFRRKKPPEWLVIDQHPISFFSPQPQEGIEKVLKHSELVARFSPFKNAAAEEIVFDQPDAMYIPLDDLDAVKGPGTVLNIYRIGTTEG